MSGIAAEPSPFPLWVLWIQGGTARCRALAGSEPKPATAGGLLHPREPKGAKCAAVKACRHTQIRFWDYQGWSFVPGRKGHASFTRAFSNHHKGSY